MLHEVALFRSTSSALCAAVTFQQVPRDRLWQLDALPGFEDKRNFSEPPDHP